MASRQCGTSCRMLHCPGRKGALERIFPRCSEAQPPHVRADGTLPVTRAFTMFTLPNNGKLLPSRRAAETTQTPLNVRSYGLQRKPRVLAAPAPTDAQPVTALRPVRREKTGQSGCASGGAPTASARVPLPSCWGPFCLGSASVRSRSRGRLTEGCSLLTIVWIVWDSLALSLPFHRPGAGDAL